MAAKTNKTHHPMERMLQELGIKHRYTRPYRPQTNGKIERFWRTLNEDLLDETTFESVEELKEELVEYLLYYNTERPHQGLGGKSPPRFPNEVQHHLKVLPWELNTARSPLKSGVKWPVFAPRDTRSGNSLQVWIAHHRQYLGSWIVTLHVPRATCRPMRTSETEFSLASNRGGPRNRLPAGWPWSRARRSSHTRPSIVSSTPILPARRTTPGVTTCHGQVETGVAGTQGGSPASLIHLRRPLAERPKAASDRHTPGHWEADLMLFRTYGQAILTLHERHSRILIAVRPPGKAASPIASAMAAILAPLPTVWRQTVSFDNGTEFARHHELHALGIETFFCDNYSPCPKNGLLK